MAQEEVKIVKGSAWTVSRIKEAMQQSDKALTTGLIKIYERQTTEEQVHQASHKRNGRGFNSADAPFLTSCAQLYKQYGYLHPEQLKWVREMMPKYATQLFNILVEDAK